MPHHRLAERALSRCSSRGVPFGSLWPDKAGIANDRAGVVLAAGVSPLDRDQLVLFELE